MDVAIDVMTIGNIKAVSRDWTLGGWRLDKHSVRPAITMDDQERGLSMKSLVACIAEEVMRTGSCKNPSDEGTRSEWVWSTTRQATSHSRVLLFSDLIVAMAIAMPNQRSSLQR